jgi:hypothetical protein
MYVIIRTVGIRADYVASLSPTAYTANPAEAYRFRSLGDVTIAIDDLGASTGMSHYSLPVG